MAPSDTYRVMVETSPCYHANLDRGSAEAALAGQPVGTYLIRPSSQGVGFYAIAFVYEDKVASSLLQASDFGVALFVDGAAEPVTFPSLDGALESNVLLKHPLVAPDAVDAAGGGGDGDGGDLSDVSELSDVEGDDNDAGRPEFERSETVQTVFVNQDADGDGDGDGGDGDGDGDRAAPPLNRQETVFTGMKDSGGSSSDSDSDDERAGMRAVASPPVHPSLAALVAGASDIDDVNRRLSIASLRSNDVSMDMPSDGSVSAASSGGGDIAILDDVAAAEAEAVAVAEAAAAADSSGSDDGSSDDGGGKDFGTMRHVADADSDADDGGSQGSIDEAMQKLGGDEDDAAMARRLQAQFDSEDGAGHETTSKRADDAPSVATLARVLGDGKMTLERDGGARLSMVREDAPVAGSVADMQRREPVGGVDFSKERIVTKPRVVEAPPTASPALERKKSKRKSKKAVSAAMSPVEEQRAIMRDKKRRETHGENASLEYVAPSAEPTSALAVIQAATAPVNESSSDDDSDDDGGAAAAVAAAGLLTPDGGGNSDDAAGAKKKKKKKQRRSRALTQEEEDELLAKALQEEEESLANAEDEFTRIQRQAAATKKRRDTEEAARKRAESAAKSDSLKKREREMAAFLLEQQGMLAQSQQEKRRPTNAVAQDSLRDLLPDTVGTKERIEFDESGGGPGAMEMQAVGGGGRKKKKKVPANFGAREDNVDTFIPEGWVVVRNMPNGCRGRELHAVESSGPYPPTQGVPSVVFNGRWTFSCFGAWGKSVRLFNKAAMEVATLRWVKDTCSKPVLQIFDEERRRVGRVFARSNLCWMSGEKIVVRVVINKKLRYHVAYKKSLCSLPRCGSYVQWAMSGPACCCASDRTWQVSTNRKPRYAPSDWDRTVHHSMAARSGDSYTAVQVEPGSGHTARLGLMALAVYCHMLHGVLAV